MAFGTPSQDTGAFPSFFRINNDDLHYILPSTFVQDLNNLNQPKAVICHPQTAWQAPHSFPPWPQQAIDTYL